MRCCSLPGKARVSVSICHVIVWITQANFIREGVLATATVLVKLYGTVLFPSPFPTSPSNHIVSRVASDFGPDMLFHPTPKTENNEDHSNDSDRISQSADTPVGRGLDSYNESHEYGSPDLWFGTPKDV